jgi:Tol biopolymer transport system component
MRHALWHAASVLKPVLSGVWFLVLLVGIASWCAAQPVARRLQTPADGGAVVASVSGDGQFFAFAHWTNSVPGDVAIVNLQTDDYRRLTNLGGYNALNSAISPDSRRVAYAWRNANLLYDLHVVGVDGSDPRLLHANEQYSVFPTDWSADGTQILAGLRRTDGSIEIALVDATEGSLRVLRALGSRVPLGLMFSPDNRFAAYDPPSLSDPTARDIFLLRMDTLEEVRLVESPTNEVLLGWTPDGTQLVFGRYREGTMDAWALPVEDGRPSGKPMVVMRDLGQMAPLRITNGGDLFFVRQRGARHIHLLEFDPVTEGLSRAPTGLHEPLGSPTFGPSWSPDGEYLAYFLTPGDHDAGPGSRRIIIRTIETGEERILSSNLDYPEGHSHELRWSPDERSLVFIAEDSQSLWSLYELDVGSGEATILVPGRPGDFYTSPEWAPDGGTIFYVHHDTAEQRSRIVAREIVSGQEAEIYNAPLSPMPFRFGRDEAMVLSPDGRYLAFSLTASPPESSGLMVLPTSGGNATALVKGRKLP